MGTLATELSVVVVVAVAVEVGELYEEVHQVVFFCSKNFSSYNLAKEIASLKEPDFLTITS